MTELIACLSTGKGTWLDVVNIIKSEDWERIFLIAPEFAKEKFKANSKVELIEINPNLPVKKIREQIIVGLGGKIHGVEVALNMSSGSGKEHMALLSALLNLGLGIRFVTIEDKKVEEI